MRRSVSILLLFSMLALPNLLATAQDGRPKVAVVLSGGGAKGAAHIGVLRAIEEVGLPIDLVVGTSMGAVIGGLYAAGYTPSQLDTLIKSQDWEFLLSDKTERQTQTLAERKIEETYAFSFSLSKNTSNQTGGLVKGQNLGSLLTKLTIGYHDVIDFADLPTPFACVATDLVDGSEVVFDSGRLAVAIRASMAIPGVFTPVRQGNMVLIDGGMTNNFPVDVARNMGADIVIGATVSQTPPTAEELTGLTNIVMQLISMACMSKWKENIADCDIHVDIDTGEYGMLDFKPEVIDIMVKRGYATTMGHSDELLAMKKQLEEAMRQSTDDETIGAERLTASEETPLRAVRDTMTAVPPMDSVAVRQITFPSENRHELRTLRRMCRLTENSTVSLNQIEKAVQMLRNDFNYTDVYYTLTDTGDEYDLTFQATNKRRSRLRVGVRFDTEDMGSVVARSDLHFNTSLPTSIYLFGRVGKQTKAAVGYRFEPVLNRGITIGYEFNYNDVDVHHHGDRLYNMTFRKHGVSVRLTDLAVRNLQWEIGAKAEYFDFDAVLADVQKANDINLQSDTYYSYYAKVNYRTLDDGYFPTSGVELTAQYSLITDDFAHMDGHTAVSAVDLTWMGAISLTESLALLPSLNCRMLISGTAPTVYSNMIGGNYDGKYLSRQLAFTGISTMEQTRDALLLGRLSLRQRFGKNHYLSLTGDFAYSADEVDDFSAGTLEYGVGARYAYQTMFGPVEAMLGFFNRAKHASFLVSLGYYF